MMPAESPLNSFRPLTDHSIHVTDVWWRSETAYDFTLCSQRIQHSTVWINIALYPPDNVKIVKWQSYYKCGHWTLPPPCSVVDYCILTELLIPSLQMTFITRLPCLSHEHIGSSVLLVLHLATAFQHTPRKPAACQLSETSLKVFYSLNFITHQNTILYFIFILLHIWQRAGQLQLLLKAFWHYYYYKL